MSNHLAIATITAVLQKILQATIQRDVEGARVTTIRPDGIGSATPQVGVNLYLYQVQINHLLKEGMGMRQRNRRGETAKRSRTAVDLHYTLSFYGNDAELQPQRLLGSTIATLTDCSAIAKEMIHETTANSTLSFLANSNLGEQVEEINVVPLDLSLEDLSKVWSVFFQTPYTLSVAYKVTAIILDGEELGEKALPVRSRGVLGGTFGLQPVVEDVTAVEGKFQPILANGTLRVRGRNLKHPETRVRLCGLEVVPPSVSETEILLPLSFLPIAALKSGVQALQVLHKLPQGGEGRAIESNVVPFVLRPAIAQMSLEELEGSQNQPRSGQLHLQVNLTLSQGQQIVVALNEWSIDNPARYLFEVPPLAADTAQITIPIQEVKPGDYLVRLHVDGAESPLQIDTNPESPTFNWYIAPKLLVL